ncbi:MAG: MOSC domain-containing protein [Acidimicrobiia bacterium]
MQLSEIWRYPVKSMAGESVATAELRSLGLDGDRGWATRDEVRGGIRGAKKIGELMLCSARYVAGIDGPVQITLPDATTTRSDDPDVNARLSAALDHQVTLWPLQPATDLDHYRRGPADTADVMVELRAIFGRTDEEPLPDFSVFPPVIMEFESPPGTYLDAFPLHVLTTSALRAVAEAVPDAVVDVSRFRPNLVVDTGDASGHPEFEWTGRRARLGGAVVEFGAACPRCVMITRAVAGGIPQDRTILRHVVRDLEQNLGVYATVVEEGPVALGDSVEFL